MAIGHLKKFRLTSAIFAAVLLSLSLFYGSGEVFLLLAAACALFLGSVLLVRPYHAGKPPSSAQQFAAYEARIEQQSPRDLISLRDLRFGVDRPEQLARQLQKRIYVLEERRRAMQLLQR